ncbi:hypothetical protein FCN77_20000 [Arthrobacter sp. 24S4-2]|uniref:hypothetical protein n=1 Tax=Arthrobacter sp. 24S4-2 TaxID=2575374 RepID=UPI0010C7D79C|nr:hypothetical protein [Arthrobacter sp. 24S4-2]QCO99573.1 hypothetical protein FCN77_20000 [Arthrobacter sp. 24S4-2]
MTAPAPACVMAFLRRAGLFAAVLALIAGIFGMHVMTATHALHSPATAAAALGAHHESSAAGRTPEHASGSLFAPDTPDAPATSGPDDQSATGKVQCTGSGNCSSMQAMSASCTPSVKTGSLTAPLPATGVSFRKPNTGAPAAISTRWSYLPGSPSPGDLCISRT